MSTCTVATLKAALGVGSLYSDAIIQEVCDAADNVLLPFLWNNDYFNVAHSADDYKRTLYFDEVIRYEFYVGQAIVVSGNDEIFNGTYTITEVGEYSISYLSEEGGRERPYHNVNPYGKVAAQDDVDYSTIPAIKEAALMVAESIWQSRQANSGNGMAPDGSMGSFYAMSSQLISRIRGLIAPYLDPRSMVG
jgi:hypothetical protein